MARLGVCSFGVSLDGYGAGPGQCFEHPLGQGGEALHQWAFATRTFNRMQGREEGDLGVDDDLFAAGFDGVGAYIIGRNMFGPDRGPWTDHPWRGWWGEDPPFHTPVFVITRHERQPLALGGTTFHFVTDGIHAALERATAAANGKDVRLGGGVSLIRQYLQAGLIDHLHLAVSLGLLGRGEALFQGLDAPALGYQTSAVRAGARATHIFIGRTPS